MVREAAIRELARSQHDAEIDDTHLSGKPKDNGAYVLAWAWVEFTATELDKHKESR